MRRRVIATSTGQRSNQYWSPIVSSTGQTSDQYWSQKPLNTGSAEAAVRVYTICMGIAYKDQRPC